MTDAQVFPVPYPFAKAATVWVSDDSEGPAQITWREAHQMPFRLGDDLGDLGARKRLGHGSPVDDRELTDGPGVC